jgi:hypothetical protein
MPWNWIKLLRELDRKRLPRGAAEEFYRRGQSAFDYLSTVLESNSLNERQLKHAIILLDRLSRFRSIRLNPDELLKIFLKYSMSEIAEIRNISLCCAMSFYIYTHICFNLKLNDNSKIILDDTIFQAEQMGLDDGSKSIKLLYLSLIKEISERDKSIN